MADNLLLNFASKFERQLLLRRFSVLPACRVSGFLRVARNACISSALRGLANVVNLVPRQEKGREGPGKKAEVRGWL